WKDVDSLPKNAEHLYDFTSYMLVTDSKDSSDAEIVVDKEILYSDGENYFMEEADASQASTEFSAIPQDVGDYLEDFAKESSDISDKESIFITWGVKHYSLKSDVEDDMEDSVEEEDISESDDEASNIAEVQKISIAFSENKTLTIDDTEGISNFYEGLATGKWTEIEALPKKGNEICVIKYYEPRRKSTDKSLTENEIMSVYQYENEYFICDEIPDNNSGNSSMDTYYQIPNTTGEYIENLRQK
ncbi:MAG: hypothetical protein PHY47_28320, partial [Lachnospiraceae bacterium]|nr:hypothetical protein [Lachnospiraceae bacterium]